MFVTSATIAITNNCNLNCRYCFEGKKNSARLSFGIAKDTIDWLFLESVSGPENINITLFGGEPFIEFMILKTVVKLAKKKSSSCGKRVSFGVTTNGTIIDNEIADFINDNKISVLLSCDGMAESHNVNRVTKNGRGSFKIIERNFDKFLNLTNAVRMTITPETTKGIEKYVRFFADLGFQDIYCVYDQNSSWKKKDILRYRDQIFGIAEYYLKAVNNDRKLCIEPIQRYVIKILDSGNKIIPAIADLNYQTCGAGKTYISISTDGTIYPCHRFLSMESFKGKYPIGNIYQGLNEDKRRTFLYFTIKNMLGCDIECMKCSVIDKCLGVCIAHNVEISGNLGIRHGKARYFELIHNEVAKSILKYCENNEKVKRNILNSEKAKKNEVNGDCCLRDRLMKIHTRT